MDIESGFNFEQKTLKFQTVYAKKFNFRFNCFKHLI